jgi:hypothetical protein
MGKDILHKTALVVEGIQLGNLASLVQQHMWA